MNDQEQSHTEAAGETVSVAGFRDPTEGQMAKGMLESAGIECFLQGENANDLFPGALRVRLHVRHADESAARSLLADVEQTADVSDLASGSAKLE